MLVAVRTKITEIQTEQPDKYLTKLCFEEVYYNFQNQK
jgi:hypothetical protein